MSFRGAGGRTGVGGRGHLQIRTLWRGERRGGQQGSKNQVAGSVSTEKAGKGGRCEPGGDTWGGTAVFLVRKAFRWGIEEQRLEGREGRKDGADRSR